MRTPLVAIWVIALGLGMVVPVRAHDEEAEATIAALETRVAELEAQLTPTVVSAPAVQRTPEAANAFEIAEGLTILS